MTHSIVTRRSSGEDTIFRNLSAMLQKIRMGEYLLVEEPDYDTDLVQKGREFSGLPLVLFPSRFHECGFSRAAKALQAREQQIWLELEIFMTCSRLQSPLYVTLSNSLGGVLRGLSPEAEMYDYQHGLVSSTQPRLILVLTGATSCLKENNQKVLVYGRGFEDIFLANRS